MTSDEAADRLRDLLTAAGVSLERPSASDVQTSWDVWRRFVLEPAEDVPSEPGDYDDGLFAQYGIFDWSFEGEREFFELDMTRQFAVPVPGSQPDLRQLGCTFRFAPTDELRALGENSLDSFEIGVDVFFEQALALPGFRGVRELRPTPTEVVVGFRDDLWDVIRTGSSATGCS